MVSRDASLEVLDLLFAGSPVEELQTRLMRLPEQERSALICKVCEMRDEVAATCRDRGEEISILLKQNCHFHAYDTWRNCPRLING